MNRRRLAIAAAVILAAAVLLFVLLGRGKKAKPTAAKDEVGETDRTPPGVPLAPRTRTPPAQTIGRAPLPTGEPLVPIIDEVIVEKQKVCRGEENLVTVRAHTPGNAEDQYLHYFIVAENGVSQPVRLQDRAAEADGAVQRQVIVFGRDNVQTSVMLPPYSVEDCDPERQLFVDRRLLPNTESEFEFTARLRDIAAAEPMTPILYKWDFGDGEKAETTTPVVTHDFGGRAQDTLFAQLLIKCEAIAANGETVLGRTGLQLLNPAFEELAGKGLVRLSVAMNPRFPELDARGMVRQTVKIWHHRPEPVKITRIIRVRNPMPDEYGQLPQPVADEIPPDAILGVPLIPREGVTVVAELDTVMDKQLFSIDYFLEGVSVEGWPAHGNFSILRPPPKPTRENSRPVMSKYVEAKIKRAMEILGKDTVTDEDIWLLEKEGAMADLREEDFPPPEEEPEPYRPDPGVAPAVPPASFEPR